MFRLTAQDRDIFRLALPAFGALAAGPLYVLVDTAIVGHLGTAPLAGLALAGTVLDGLLALCGFLAYATTGHVGRRHAAGDGQAASSLAAQAMWLALGLGGAFVLAMLIAGPAVIAGLGGRGEVGELAVLYLRIAALGLPFALVSLAGQGVLRGLDELTFPLQLVVGGNVANAVLEVLFVYGFGWGVAGSAAATVLAQIGMGGGFIVKLWRLSAGARRPRLPDMRPLLRTSGEIFVRTAALYGTFVAASAVLARVGAASLAAHQVLFQLWIFLALALDAIAIAGQVLVSRGLGRGDRAEAMLSARRMVAWSVAFGAAIAAGLMLLRDVLPLVFTGEADVLQQVHVAWAIFALMQPLNGAVFALDGILIGAGDTRYLMWSMLLSGGLAVPLAVAALFEHWGIGGVWLALLLLIVLRTATNGSRFASARWAVVNPHSPRRSGDAAMAAVE